jgi:ribosomal protein S18 acetylase RimI-like enzyme
MIAIEKVVADDIAKFQIIRIIAQETWPIAYREILSTSQLEYMFDMMYSTTSLLEQAAKKNLQFVLAKEGNDCVGFASYEMGINQTTKTKIHKIYILPSKQRKGIGEKLIDYIAVEAAKQKNNAVFLNVNKNNKALHFYLKLGFSKVKEEVIDIGSGYVMDDYVMEKMFE